MRFDEIVFLQSSVQTCIRIAELKTCGMRRKKGMAVWYFFAIGVVCWGNFFFQQTEILNSAQFGIGKHSWWGRKKPCTSRGQYYPIGHKVLFGSTPPARHASNKEGHSFNTWRGAIFWVADSDKHHRRISPLSYRKPQPVMWQGGIWQGCQTP